MASADPMLSDDEFQLLDVLRRGHGLTQAAAALDKPASTLSYTLRRLETRFAAGLFDRSQYRMGLTPAGELLLRESERLRRESRRVERRVMQTARGWEPAIAVVIDEFVGDRDLLPAITALDALAVGVELRITRFTRLTRESAGTVPRALLDGRADLAIGSFDRPSRLEGLESRVLGEVPLLLVAAAGHSALRNAAEFSAVDLAEHREVAVAASPSTDPAPGAADEPAPRRRLLVPSLEAMRAAIEAGLGHGWLPAPMVRDALDRGDLVRLPGPDASRTVPLNAAWRGPVQGRAIRALLDGLGGLDFQHASALMSTPHDAQRRSALEGPARRPFG